MKIKTLDVQLSKGRQDVRFVELAEANLGGPRILEPVKLKIEIRSDSYKFQSSAVLKVWEPARQAWNDCVSIPYGSMRTKEGLVYGRGAFASDFVDDRNELVRLASLVLA